jgi:hypothetical protein
MKTPKTLRSRITFTKIFMLLVILWLALLTKYAVDSRDIQHIQAKNDSEIIYKLMLKSADQQQKIDALNR